MYLNVEIFNVKILNVDVFKVEIFEVEIFNVEIFNVDIFNVEIFVRQRAAPSTDAMEQLLLMDRTFLLKLTSDLYWRGGYSAPELTSLSGALPIGSLDVDLIKTNFTG